MKSNLHIKEVYILKHKYLAHTLALKNKNIVKKGNFVKVK